MVRGCQVSEVSFPNLSIIMLFHKIEKERLNINTIIIPLKGVMKIGGCWVLQVRLHP